MNKKRIGIDIMGEPGAAEAAIIAIVNFLNIYDDVEVTIFGKESIVKKNFKLLRKAKFFVNLKFEYTDVVILSTDTMKTINNKADASMLKMIESSKNNLLDAVCSSGNTLVYFFSCYTNLTLIKKTIKPALLATFPTTLNNKRFITLDVGANLNCNALDLLNFAQMAIIYFNLTINIQKPVVGILNIGIEKTKGHTIQQQLYKMLEDNKSINFYGNIEPRNVLNGVVDIVVCDGWTGNIFLKSLEGAFISLYKTIKNNATINVKNKLISLFLKNQTKQFFNKFNYHESGSAYFIGFKKVVIKTHGESDASAFFYALKMAYVCVDKKINERIHESI